jgi:prephenate dehydrogenase
MAILKARGDELEVLGHDKDPGKATKAHQMGAITEVEDDSISACSKADMLIFAIPANGIRETLELVASDLKEGCVVTDTASVKVPVLQWADELLPPEVSFVGGDPILFGDDTGIDMARADLFADKQYCITPSTRASSEATNTMD